MTFPSPLPDSTTPSDRPLVGCSCGTCADAKVRRRRAATNGCPDCDYELPFHNADGSCPTEAEARERSGAQ